MQFYKKTTFLLIFWGMNTCDTNASGVFYNDAISELSTLNIDELIKEKSKNEFLQEEKIECKKEFDNSDSNKDFPTLQDYRIYLKSISNNTRAKTCNTTNKTYKVVNPERAFLGNSIGGFENWDEVKSVFTDLGRKTLEAFKSLLVLLRSAYTMPETDLYPYDDVYPID